MDGVLTGFARQILLNAGISCEEFSDKTCEKILKQFPKNQIWKYTKGNFWETLPWMQDGKMLWDYIKSYDPIILSAMSLDKKCELGKKLWCLNELGKDVKVITCFKKFDGIKGLGKVKAIENLGYNIEESLLIDDDVEVWAAWENAGGPIIKHTSFENTKVELEKLGL